MSAVSYLEVRCFKCYDTFSIKVEHEKANPDKTPDEWVEAGFDPGCGKCPRCNRLTPLASDDCFTEGGFDKWPDEIGCDIPRGEWRPKCKKKVVY